MRKRAKAGNCPGNRPKKAVNYRRIPVRPAIVAVLFCRSPVPASDCRCGIFRKRRAISPTAASISCSRQMTYRLVCRFRTRPWTVHLRGRTCPRTTRLLVFLSWPLFEYPRSSRENSYQIVWIGWSADCDPGLVESVQLNALRNTEIARHTKVGTQKSERARTETIFAAVIGVQMNWFERKWTQRLLTRSTPNGRQFLKDCEIRPFIVQ